MSSGNDNNDDTFSDSEVYDSGCGSVGD